MKVFLSRFRPLPGALLLACLTLVLSACTTPPEPEPRALRLEGDANRCGALNTDVRLRVTAHGQDRRTLFGGRRETVLHGAAVSFEVISSPEGGDGVLALPRVPTDAGGHAETVLDTGSVPGNYRVRIWLPEYPQIEPLEVLVLAGLSCGGGGQDGMIGKVLREPLCVMAESAPGRVRPGVDVDFRLMGGPAKTGFLDTDEATGHDGRACAQVRLGEAQGKGEVTVQVLSEPWHDGRIAPELHIKFFALDPWGVAIRVLGGLAVFIFGMRLMSEGLSLAAGDRLRGFLNMLMRNRAASVVVGVVVTGLIQSSSACSVMVIGFVNAGLIGLEQAIGVIMGANVGTTVTAQMISFKLEALALPAVAVGVAILLLARRSTSRFAAQILVGFGLLFLGMSMMSDPLKVLKDAASVHRMFAGLCCAPTAGGQIPLGAAAKAVAAGAFITVLVQSSSASIGLLLSLAGAGLLDAYTAFAILLGTNIGTTVTAVLASIGSSVMARRAACAHVLFNVLGTGIMLVLFFVPWHGNPVFMELVSYTITGDPFAGENLPRFLANAHTGFNVACVLLFVWFVGAFAAVTRMVVPAKAHEPVVPSRILDRHLLNTPALALAQAWAELAVMLDKSRLAMTTALKATLESQSEEFATMSADVRALEAEVDDLQAAVTEYVSNLTRSPLNEDQGRMLPRLLHSVNDAERIGDYAMQLLRLGRRVRKRELVFSPAAQEEMGRIFNSTESLLTGIAEFLKDGERMDLALSRDPAVAEELDRLRILAKLVRKQAKDFRRAHEERFAQSICDVRSGVVFTNMLTSLERVSGHVTNIVQALSAREQVTVVDRT